MAKDYLDQTGLAYFWSKVKTYVTNAVKVTGVKGNSESSYRTGNVNITADNVNAITKSQAGNTQFLSRPTGLRGLADVTLQPLVNTTRANRLAFLPADQIIIEKTTDGGVTWVDAGVTDAVKVGLFSETRASVSIPLLNGVRSLLCGIRITITAMKYNVPDGTTETQKYNYWNSNYVRSQERYCQLKEFYFWLNAVSDSIGLKVERATGANSTNWSTIFDDTSYYMTGWSGCDYVKVNWQSTFGGGSTQTGNHWNYRFTFMTRGVNGTETMATSSTTQAQTLMEIRGYGDTWWGKSNEYMANDKMYTHDYQQNVTFPAKVTATGFAGNVSGYATSLASEVARPSSANNLHDNTKRVRAFLASGTMTTAKPPHDAHMLHFNWDNGTSGTGTWDAQLAISNTNANIYVRAQNSGTWSDWQTVYSTSNKPTKSDVGLGNVDNTADANKSVASATKATQDGSGNNIVNTYLTKAAGVTNVAFDSTNNKITKTINGTTTDVVDFDTLSIGNASTVNNHTVNSDVPANAVFTDTTYSVATQSADGLMSSTDKTKLDGVDTGAQVNQNAYATIAMESGSWSGSLSATSPSDTFTLKANAPLGIVQVTNPQTGLKEASFSISMDDAPTQNSAKAVKSGGVYGALSTKAGTASPTFTGTPKAPTASAGTNTTQIATTAFVKTAIDNAISGGGGNSDQITDSGIITSASFAANAYTDHAVTFNKTFPSEPRVFVAIRSSSTSTSMSLLTIGVLASSVTTTGFTIRGWNGHTSSFAPTIYWFATLPTSTPVGNTTFISKKYTATISSINANGSAALTATQLNMSTPTGYYPFALGGSYCSSSTCVFRFIDINAVENGHNACAFRNVGTSSQSNVSVEITVVYSSQQTLVT